MNLYDAIKRLHPQAEQPGDFEVRDDGNGPRIASWRLAAKRPTAAELTDAWTALEAERVAAETAANTERTDLQRILDKINAGTSLTADDLRRALRPVLRERLG